MKFLPIARIVVAMLFAAPLVACETASTPAVEMSDIERTWRRATVVLPPFGAGAPLRTTMDSPAMAARLHLIPGGSRVPVMI